MKSNLINILAGVTLLTFGQNANSQCPSINCSNNTVVSTDPSMCDAIVTFAAPTAIDICNLGGSQTFNFTGAQQTWVVPNGVTSINVDAYGAQGGSNSPQTNVNYGGRVQADIPVTPGSTIFIYVGEQPNGLTGGWNGGGNGETGGQGGGGSTDIRIGGTTLNDRVIVAGGAGGGGFWSGLEVHGGLGGGLTAGPGYRTDISTPGGDPGSQTSSGLGTCSSLNNPVVAGGFGFGGAPQSCGCEGYGGGGGWWGGAGSGNCRGGGGGSSYTAPSATNVIHTQGVKVGHGSLTISWDSETPNITQIAGLASGAAFPIGATTQTFIAESGGAVDTCSFVITVVDNEAPSISCGGNAIEICAGTLVSIPAPATADNCTSAPTVTYFTTGATSVSGNDSISGVLFNPGTTTVWYMATDSSGNVDSCSINILVNPAPIGSETVTECDSYTWSSNGQTYTQSGQYTEVLTNQSGCDSTVTLNLTITNSNAGSETVTECNSYTWNTNGQTYTQSGQYTEVLTNQVGCDSTVTLNLTINSSSSSTQTDSGVDSYTWSVNNQTYTQSGTYTAVVPNASGCDSTITLDLTLQFTGLDENESSYVAVYPNPTYSSFTLSTKDMIHMNYTLLDIQGKVVLTGKIESTEETVDISKLYKGQYNLVFEDESISPISIIKN